MDAIYDFVKLFTHTKYKNIPEEARHAAKIEVLDSFATALGGTSKPGVAELVDMAKELGGREQSTVIAYGFKCPAPNAAQVNASMVHALDYDDGHPKALVHLGCVAVPTCFAVAERMGKKSGEELITAMALGQDFESRLGNLRLASYCSIWLFRCGGNVRYTYGF
jgi:2-methylcitrate dehydratase PrpD